MWTLLLGCSVPWHGWLPESPDSPRYEARRRARREDLCYTNTHICTSKKGERHTSNKHRAVRAINTRLPRAIPACVQLCVRTIRLYMCMQCIASSCVASRQHSRLTVVDRPPASISLQALRVHKHSRPPVGNSVSSLIFNLRQNTFSFFFFFFPLQIYRLAENT